MDRSTMPFPEFYTWVLTGYHGTSVRNGPGCRPRGSFTRAKPGALKLMVVLQNPGKPINQKELDLEKGLSNEQLAQELWHYSGDVWEGKYQSKTLRTARQEVSALLGVSGAECTKHAMFTNLVRCTSDTLDADVVRIGAEWLKEEIRLWCPKFVIAYGDIPRKSMQKHSIHFDDHLPHPAALGTWLIPGRREQRVREVRDALQI